MSNLILLGFLLSTAACVLGKSVDRSSAATAYAYKGRLGVGYGLVEPAPVVEVVGDYGDYDYEDGAHSGDFANEAGVYDSHDDQGYGGHQGKGHSYENGDSSVYAADGNSAHVDEGSEGHETHHDSNKGDVAEHEAESQEGHYSKGAGDEAKHFDEADEHGSNYSTSKGYKGGDSGERKSHSKGEKTTGFHNVYHKDEYKKNKEFYDEDNNSGHFEKHGGGTSENGEEHGGHVQSSKHDAGYQENESGQEGFNKVGHHHNTDSSFLGKAGDENHHAHHQDFAKKGGSSHEQEQGYEDGDDY